MPRRLSVAIAFALLTAAMLASRQLPVTPNWGNQPTVTTGRTLKSTTAGCGGGSCHTQNTGLTPTITPTVAGGDSLYAGDYGIFQINGVTATGVVSQTFGFDIAASDHGLNVLAPGAGEPESTNVINGDTEVTHNRDAGFGPLRFTNSNAALAGSYKFQFTMPASAAVNSTHTLYGVIANGTNPLYWNNNATIANPNGLTFIVTTKPPPAPPTTATAGVPTSSTVPLSWTGGGPQYRIMAKTLSAPTGITDGTIVYEGSGTSATASGLGPATQYFFTVFSKDLGAYSGAPFFSTTGAQTSAITTDPNPWVDAVNGSDTNAGASFAPFKTITKAMASVSAGATVHVRSGTYNTALGEQFPITVLSGVKLQSTTGAASTIIDASGANTRVLYCGGNSSTTLIEGFTVRGGLFQAPAGSNGNGGGILTDTNDQTTISRCIITNNEGRGHNGDAVSVFPTTAYGGGVSINGAQTTLVNCLISNNVARGGSGYSPSSAGSGGNAADGHGGGVYAFSSTSGQPNIVNCTFNANQAIGGNGGNASGPNRGGSAGGAFYAALDGQTATIINDIFANNVVTGGTAGAGSPNGAAATLFGGVSANSGTNNLFFNNTAGNGFTGTSPITGQDPQFISTSDLHLRSFSPARRAGTATGAPAVDLDGNPRTTPPTIGTYEIGLFLSATAGIGRITITWPGVVGASSYNLYMSQTAGVTTTTFQRKVTGATSPFVLSGLANGTTYYFVITAIENGVEGPISPEVSATVASGTWAKAVGGTFTNITRDLANGTTLYAAAADAVGLYKSTDGGDTWNPLTGIINGRDIRAVVANGLTVIVATRDGDLLRSADGGATWSVVLDGKDIGETVKSLAIDPLSTNTIYGGDFSNAGFGHDMVVKSIDGGLTFNFLPSGSISAYVIQVDPITAGTLWEAGSGTSNIAKSTDGGNTWTAPFGQPGTVSPGNNHVLTLVMAPSQPATLYTGLKDPSNTTSTGLSKTTDGGSTWTVKNTGFPASLPDVYSLLVDPNDANRVHAGTSAGYYSTSDGASNWAAGPTGGPYPSASLVFNAFAQTSTRRLIGTTTNGIFMLALDPPPTITSINPTSGASTGSTSVSITGTGFRSGATATFGGIAATNVVVVNATTITATTPAHAAGAVDVAVGNSDGQTAILVNGFTYSGIACSYSIAPTSASFSSNAATGSVSVTTTASCPWSAVSSAGFLTITSGASGSGNGTVGYSVAANTSGSTRTGTLTVAGITFTVSQSGKPPGDINGDGDVTVTDVIYLINNLFAGGAAPVGSGDANGDGQVTVGDIFYLINYLYAGGPAPH